MKIRNLLNEKGYGLWYTTPDKVVFNAVKMLDKKDVGALMVIENDELVGIFSERDLARKVSLRGKSPTEVTVGEVMRRNVITVDIDSTVKDAMALMTVHDIRHLPVIEGNNLVGIVSIGDLCQAVLAEENILMDVRGRKLTTSSVPV